MHIVVMGCGRVGSSLARSLERRGHTVAIIDVDVEAFRRLGPDFRGETVKGVGFDRDVLRRAGIERADGFAAVSSGDNSNVLAARVVREQFGVENVVARIYDQGRAEVYERLGIPTVATVRWAANQVLRSLLPEESEPVWRDPTGSVRLVQMTADPAWVGWPIRDIEDAISASIPFVTRFRQGMVPDDHSVLQEGDVVYVALASPRQAEIARLLGNPPTQLDEESDTAKGKP